MLSFLPPTKQNNDPNFIELSFHDIIWVRCFPHTSFFVFLFVSNKKNIGFFFIKKKLWVSVFGSKARFIWHFLAFSSFHAPPAPAISG